jgi:RNA polymerase sigma factor (sigma-70 family)
VNHAQTIALYHPLLQSIAFRILKCQADAEDMVQDTFLKWLNAEHEKIQNTKAYLIAAVTNNCLNHLQTFRKKKLEYLEGMDMTKLKEKWKVQLDLSHLDLEMEVKTALRIVHEKLEPLERAVFLMKEVFNIDYDGIQLVLEKKKDNCRQLFSRARKKLQEGTDRWKESMPDVEKMADNFKAACDFDKVDDFIHSLKEDIYRVMGNNALQPQG